MPTLDDAFCSVPGRWVLVELLCTGASRFRDRLRGENFVRISNVVHRVLCAM